MGPGCGCTDFTAVWEWTQTCAHSNPGTGGWGRPQAQSLRADSVEINYGMLIYLLTLMSFLKMNSMSLQDTGWWHNDFFFKETHTNMTCCHLVTAYFMRLGCITVICECLESVYSAVSGPSLCSQTQSCFWARNTQTVRDYFAFNRKARRC